MNYDSFAIYFGYVVLLSFFFFIQYIVHLFNCTQNHNDGQPSNYGGRKLGSVMRPNSKGTRARRRWKGQFMVWRGSVVQAHMAFRWPFTKIIGKMCQDLSLILWTSRLQQTRSLERCWKLLSPSYLRRRGRRVRVTSDLLRSWIWSRVLC